MNLKFVEAFYWSASLKSITKAASKLHLTQSAISSRIACLERDLGTLLIDRGSRNFHLTQAGERFHTLSMTLLSLSSKIKEEMSSHSLMKKTLKVGAIESVAHSWLASWLKYMQTHHPHFSLELSVETTPLLKENFLKGKLDLMFSTTPIIGENLKSISMQPLPMCFSGNKNIHHHKSYDLTEVLSSEILTFQRGSQPHNIMLDLIKSYGLPDNHIHAISSISAMIQLVIAGFGIAFLPCAILETVGKYMPLCRIDVDMDLPSLPMFASVRQDPTEPLLEEALRSAIDHASHNYGA